MTKNRMNLSGKFILKHRISVYTVVFQFCIFVIIFNEMHQIDFCGWLLYLEIFKMMYKIVSEPNYIILKCNKFNQIFILDGF